MRRGIVAAVVGLVGCASATPPPNELARPEGEPLEFAFGALDGGAVTSENTRGRLTALLFVTTYDLPSQVAARRLGEVARTHVPRINAAAIALEAAENGVLVQVFRDSLGLTYPVALADAVEIHASPAFSRVAGVPTLVLLDRDGRRLLQRFGLFEARELAGWLADAERLEAGP